MTLRRRDARHQYTSRLSKETSTGSDRTSDRPSPERGRGPQRLWSDGNQGPRRTRNTSEKLNHRCSRTSRL